MCPEIGYPYPRLFPIKRAPLIPNDRSAISGRSWGNRGQTHRQSGRPSFWAPISDKDASILAHFSRSDIGLGICPIIGHTQPRLGSRNWDPSIPNDWSAISGRSWGNRGQPTTSPGDPRWALIAAKDAPILAHFSLSDIGLGSGPEIGYP